MSYEVTKEILNKVNEIGEAESAKLFNTSENNIKKWKSGTMLPSSLAAQVIIDRDIRSGRITITGAASSEASGIAPPAQGRTIPEKVEDQQAEPPKKETAITPSEESITPEAMATILKKHKRHHILLATHRDFPPFVVESIMGNWKASLPVEARPYLAPLKVQSDTLIHRARNLLAQHFLDGGAEWSWWLDSDIIAPIGNPHWYRNRTESKHQDRWSMTSALEKLCNNGKMICGAPYSERHPRGKIIASCDFGAKPSRDEQEASKKLKTTGPFAGIIKVEWIGFGCVAVHRQVFEDILKTQEDVKPNNDKEPPHFFTAFEGGPQGEDVAFCKRAALAGHATYMDCSIPLAHIGRAAFNL